jgi:hypothetical protein
MMNVVMLIALVLLAPSVRGSQQMQPVRLARPRVYVYDLDPKFTYEALACAASRRPDFIAFRAHDGMITSLRL